MFTSKFVTTIGVDYRDKLCEVDGKKMRLQLWDTAGQERFRSLTSNFFGRADGFVLCYDISNRPSFDHVASWMSDIRAKAPKDCVVVLCGNKCDLGEADRVVSTEEGRELAGDFGIGFFEVSALKGEGVEDIFFNLARAIKDLRIPLENDSYSSGRIPAPGSGGLQPLSPNSGNTIHLDQNTLGSQKSYDKAGLKKGIDKFESKCCL